MKMHGRSLAYDGGCVKMVVVKNEQKAFEGIADPSKAFLML